MGLDSREPQEYSRRDLVMFMRGSFTAPIISSLYRRGAIERMLTDAPYGPTNFPTISNQRLLSATLTYFANLGLVEDSQDPTAPYQTTGFGREILKRSSSFLSPHSYRADMATYDQGLDDPLYQRPPVDRVDNILGSGKTHGRYFTRAIEFISQKQPIDTIVDIGCGAGQFLNRALQAFPTSGAVGVDLSEISVNESAKLLQTHYPDRTVHTLQADAADIETWAAAVAETVDIKNAVLSLWFILHEISESDPDRVADLLTRIHAQFPDTPLVIGELVKHGPTILAPHSKESVMPEYLFLHDLSGQGPLSWENYRKVLGKIPYKLQSERKFDEIGPPSQEEPAVFVWYLLPDKQ